MTTLLLALGLLAVADASEAGRIAIQHEGRVKPLDTFARQLVQYLTEKERFSGYTDPNTGERVEVFPDGDPVRAVLGMVSDPARLHGLRFIKITHPQLKEKFGLDPSLTYFSLADLDPKREALEKEEAAIEDPDDATSAQRAVLKIVHQWRTIEAIYTERILTIIPIPVGDRGTWLTPLDVRRWLAGDAATDGRSRTVAAAIEAHLGGSAERREALRKVVEQWDAAVRGLGEGDLSGFEGLADRLRELNPEAFPDASRLKTEIRYNDSRPFHKASVLFFVASLLFLFSFIVRSRVLWLIAGALHAGSLALCAYGFSMRWEIAGRWPLANHYESMIACSLAGAFVGMIAEAVATLVKPRARGLIGMSVGLVASVLLVLANNVPTFAEQGFVAPLVPALQTFWMAIHVPVIMTGYAMGMILAVMGHVYLFAVIFRRVDKEFRELMDAVMYWFVRLTVLFLLAGIVLGAVWAGEAWGRPWGWDMKETWALITLLCYLAMTHARFVGVLKPYWMAVTSLVAFFVMILTYYGVNFLFGKGLHTYGFGSGDAWYLSLFGIAEVIVIGLSLPMYLSGEAVAEGPVPPEQATLSD